MSIYRRTRFIDPYDLELAQAADEMEAVGVSSSSPATVDSQPWSRFRKAQPADVLLPQTRKLLDQLPPGVFPAVLAARYPRIVNLIALHWSDRDSCGRYFNGLLNDQRGGRRGFPVTVQRDLLKLAEYWYDHGQTWEI